MYAWSRNLGGLISVLLFGAILVLLRVHRSNVAGIAEKQQKRQHHVTVTIAIRYTACLLKCVVFNSAHFCSSAFTLVLYVIPMLSFSYLAAALAGELSSFVASCADSIVSRHLQCPTAVFVYK